MDEQAVKQEILIAFEYAHFHEDWVTPLSEVFEGMTAPEAAWKPNAETPSIWQIVLHMTVWTENIVERMAQRMQGELPGHPSEGAWPPLPVTLDEAAWENHRQRLENALTALRTHIETTPLAAMLDYGNAGYSQLADLFCRFTHNAYHLGQITKLREWYALPTRPLASDKVLHQE